MSEYNAGVQSRLVIAVDVSTRTEAMRLVESLAGLVGMFKIGLQLFTAEGPGLVQEIVASGQNVFSRSEVPRHSPYSGRCC